MEKKKRPMLESFNAAIEGIVWVLKSQKNMKFHFIAAAAILIVALFLELTKIELIFLAFAIVFVLTAEMFNTAIEHISDFISPDFKPEVRIIKDVSAGAVLLSAINAVAVGYLIFFVRLIRTFPSVIYRVHQAPAYLTFIAIFLVVLFSLAVKARVHRKGPLGMIRGGMPSLHAAMAFACLIIVIFVSRDILISLLVFLLSVLISQSRVREGVHTFSEVIVGALLGALVPVLIFQLFG